MARKTAKKTVSAVADSEKETNIANANNSLDSKKEDKSPRVPQRSKFQGKIDFHEQFDYTENQLEIIKTIMDKNTKVVFIDAVAGTGKTHISAFCGLKLIDQKKVSHLLYVRSLAESASKGIGFLKGAIDEKFSPFLMPLEDKIDEIIHKASRDKLYKEERIEAIPVNFLRGASLNATFVLIDEAQNFDLKEMTTVLTRIGEFSKFVFVGDSNQSDINGKSGFKKVYDMFNDDESKMNGIHCFKLGKEDIVRSGILKFIAERLEDENYGKPHVNNNNNRQEPMFDDMSVYHRNGVKSHNNGVKIKQE